MEVRLGRHAIPGLIRYVVLFNALVFGLQLVSPGFLSVLALDPARVVSGEVWRLFTWIFIPGTTDPLWILFSLLFLWFLGELLEASWTSFRVNLFYLTGWFLATFAAMFLPGANMGPGANLFLNLSILLAVATLQPNYQILLFFILPVKIKWIAWFSLLLPLLLFGAASPAGKAAIFLSLANYLLFFAPGFFMGRVQRAKTASRKARFDASKLQDEPLHSCSICGRTDESHPDLEFRVAADGNEYCTDHLLERK